MAGTSHSDHNPRRLVPSSSRWRRFRACGRCGRGGGKRAFGRCRGASGGAWHEGWRVNHKRVAGIMRESGLSVQPQRRTVPTSDGDCGEAVFPSLVRDFTPTGPNQLWVGLSEEQYWQLVDFKSFRSVCQIWSTSSIAGLSVRWDALAEPGKARKRAGSRSRERHHRHRVNPLRGSCAGATALTGDAAPSAAEGLTTAGSGLPAISGPAGDGNAARALRTGRMLIVEGLGIDAGDGLAGGDLVALADDLARDRQRVRIGAAWARPSAARDGTPRWLRRSANAASERCREKRLDWRPYRRVQTGAEPCPAIP